MEVSEKGRALIKRWESLRLVAYEDSGKVWTIGYGSIKGVHEGMRITTDQAEALFLRDLQETERGLNLILTNQVNQNQFDALACWSFNVGIKAAKQSTLIKYLNLGEIKEAAGEFLRWNKITVGGKKVVMHGLTMRRACERDLFLT